VRYIAVTMLLLTELPRGTIKDCTWLWKSSLTTVCYYENGLG